MTSQNADRIRRSIALIGYRGSGKTTVGRELAGILKLPFIDTDEMIVEAAGRPVSEIFTNEGEERFRELEKKTIGELRSLQPSVISVGGGAVIDSENVAVLQSVATIVWLTAPSEVLANRILGDTQSAKMRPALTDHSPREEIERVLRERTPLYRQAADHTVDTEDRAPAEIAASIAALILS